MGMILTAAAFWAFSTWQMLYIQEPHFTGEKTKTQRVVKWFTQRDTSSKQNRYIYLPTPSIPFQCTILPQMAKFFFPPTQLFKIIIGLGLFGWKSSIYHHSLVSKCPVCAADSCHRFPRHLSCGSLCCSPLCPPSLSDCVSQTLYPPQKARHYRDLGEEKGFGTFVGGRE